MNRDHPLAALLRAHASDDDEGETVHALSREAQVANLQAAWEYYRSAKSFNSGDFLQGRKGLGVSGDDPVFLYVRALNAKDPQDMKIAEDTLSRSFWNKIDCIVARLTDSGLTIFQPYDSDLLERLS